MTFLIILTALVLAFVIAPLVVVVVVSFGVSQMMEFPPRAFSLVWYERYFTSADWLNATRVSVEVGLGTALLATLLGTAVALAFRPRFAGSRLVHGVMIAPMVVPSIVIAIAAYFFFVPLTKMGLPLLGSRLGLILAHTVLAIPFVFVTVLASVQGLDPMLEKAAASCGAHPLQAFRRVTLPVIMPGVVSGAIFAFVASFDEVVIALFLSGARVRTLPIKMWEGVRFEIDPTVPAVATLMMVLSLAVMAVSQLLRRRARTFTASPSQAAGHGTAAPNVAMTR
ncbi:ABC transporter permease [Acuticoccus sediminis]|nr:ABC transporter permease [Acuticoccus sediminis]